jgi:hypothetical protein
VQLPWVFASFRNDLAFTVLQGASVFKVKLFCDSDLRTNVFDMFSPLQTVFNCFFIFWFDQSHRACLILFCAIPNYVFNHYDYQVMTQWTLSYELSPLASIRKAPRI